MNRLFVPLLASLIFLSSAHSQWASAIGGTSSDRASGIAVDASGNVYITGTFNGTADFDPSGGATNLTSAGNSDIFFAKYNSSGALVWAKSVGGTGIDISNGIVVDASGNVYIVGYFNGTADFDPGAGTSNLVSNGGTEIFFAKYNSSGSLVWAKSVGGTSNDVGRAIALDGNGNVYITGEYRLTADFDPGAGTTNLTSQGNGDVFIAEYSSSGTFVMAISMGGTSSDSGYGIGVDGVGLITITGEFNGTADFDPGTGTVNLTSAGVNDIFLAQYDNSGNWQWSYAFGGSSADYARGLRVDANGGDIYVTGVFNGSVDFNPGVGTATLTSAGLEEVFFAKYDAAGGYVFAKSVGGSFSDIGYGITLDGSGNVYITGTFAGNDADFDPGAGTTTLSDPGASGVYFAKYNSSGSLVWAKGIGDISDDEGRAITVDGSGNVYVAGYFGGTFDFDPGAGTTNLTSAGSDDIFFSKYQGSGVLPVEMTSLTATSTGLDADLRWKTISETNNLGFEIERRGLFLASATDADGVYSQEWKRIGYIGGAGTTSSPRSYSYTDASLPAGRYCYRIKQVNQDGSYKYSGEAELEIGAVQKQLMLYQNYPNPFNPSTTIRFSLPSDGHAIVKVYDVTGHEVATLFNNDAKAGYAIHAVLDGHDLASGVYFVRLGHGNNQLTQKIVLMK